MVASKRWGKGAVLYVAMRHITEALEELIGWQRGITEFEGADEDFISFVANKAWPVDRYQLIGYNSGHIDALLEMEERLKSGVSKKLIDQARYYTYVD